MLARVAATEPEPGPARTSPVSWVIPPPEIVEEDFVDRAAPTVARRGSVVSDREARTAGDSARHARGDLIRRPVDREGDRVADTAAERIFVFVEVEE
jgi:hypothetical protein